MAARQRTTAEERAWVVAEWEASGQSAVAFAQTMGIAMCTLYGWRRQIRAKAKQSDPARPAASAHTPVAQPTSPSMAEVILRPSAPSQPAEASMSGIEITIGDAVIRIGESFDDHHLRRILDVLRASR